MSEQRGTRGFALSLRNAEDLDERHLVDRRTYRTRRSATLAQWQSLAS